MARTKENAKNGEKPMSPEEQRKIEFRRELKKRIIFLDNYQSLILKNSRKPKNSIKITAIRSELDYNYNISGKTENGLDFNFNDLSFKLMWEETKALIKNGKYTIRKSQMRNSRRKSPRRTSRKRRVSRRKSPRRTSSSKCPKGKVINPNTGRCIIVGGPTYKKLFG